MSRSIAILFGAAIVLAACGGGDSQPIANAGPDFELIMGQSPTFDGCDSSGDMVNYKWVIISAPEAMAQDAGKVIREVDSNCSFTLEASMHVEEVGEWVIELQITDSKGNTDTDTVVVTVTG